MTVLVNWHDQAKSETIRQHGCKPPNTVIVAFGSIFIVGYVVPTCFAFVDSVAQLFARRTLARDDQMFYAFQSAGIDVSLTVGPLHVAENFDGTWVALMCSASSMIGTTVPSAIVRNCRPSCALRIRAGRRNVAWTLASILR